MDAKGGEIVVAGIPQASGGPPIPQPARPVSGSSRWSWSSA